MGEVVALRHLAFEDLGLLEPLLSDRGHKVRYCDVPSPGIEGIDPLTPSLMVILGGPVAAFDDEDYPFLGPETALIAARLENDLPTIGICLGAQLMARALGAEVRPAITEIGWSSLTLTGAGEKSCLRHLGGPECAVLHWHGDMFELPDGAYLLASTEACPHQAFSWGKNSLALQFHPEVTVSGLESWFVGHAGEITRTDGISVHDLRSDSAKYCPDAAVRGKACFTEWLDFVGL